MRTVCPEVIDKIFLTAAKAQRGLKLNRRLTSEYKKLFEMVDQAYKTANYDQFLEAVFDVLKKIEED